MRKVKGQIREGRTRVQISIVRVRVNLVVAFAFGFEVELEIKCPIEVEYYLKAITGENIDGGGGFVEEDDGRAAENGARDADQLALSHREVLAVLAHVAVQLAREALLWRKEKMSYHITFCDKIIGVMWCENNL